MRHSAIRIVPACPPFNSGSSVNPPVCFGTSCKQCNSDQMETIDVNADRTFIVMPIFPLSVLRPHEEPLGQQFPRAFL
jgi:hypothetical protein